MLQEGLSHTTRLTVGEQHTAIAMGSGDMPVLATPVMIAMMENAAMLAVDQEFPAESTTVGTAISATHVKASPVGAVVESTATLERIDGRKLYFRVEARQDGELIGEGNHTRVVVDRERFMQKVQG